MKQDKSSTTAQLITLGLFACQQEPHLNKLLPNILFENNLLNIKINPTLNSLSKLLKLRLFRRLFFKFETLYIPGLSVHYLLRKAKLRQWLKQEIEKNNYQQLPVSNVYKLT